MSTDSTGNNGPLSFADKLSFSERKRLKCFPAMMHIEQIATLEHPDSLERQKTLALALIDACERGELPSIPDQQYDDGWIEDGLVFGWWHKTLELCEGPTPIISREAYQAWRAQCPARLLSDLSHIGAWLGATPATESIPPIETSLPEPARPARAKGGSAKKRAALLALLDEVDKRAAKQGAGFNRHCLPGTKAEFQTLAIAFNRSAFYKALSTFDDYLEGQCQFPRGAKQHGKGAAIWALFPEYDLKLG